MLQHCYATSSTTSKTNSTFFQRRSWFYWHSCQPCKQQCAVVKRLDQGLMAKSGKHRIVTEHAALPHLIRQYGRAIVNSHGCRQKLWAIGITYTIVSCELDMSCSAFLIATSLASPKQVTLDMPAARTEVFTGMHSVLYVPEPQARNLSDRLE